MDFIKKNSAWIALAGLVLAGYVYYKCVYSTETKYTGKVRTTNPVI